MLNTCPQAQRGATLIEVLVTLVVLSIGLLGMAGLQTLSIKTNNSAYYRSQATFLAYDITERMRANRDVALAGGYAVDFPQSSTSNNTDKSELVERDLAQWLNSLAATLPDGTGRINRNGNLVTVMIRWDDSRGAIQSLNSGPAAAVEIFAYWTEI